MVRARHRLRLAAVVFVVLLAQILIYPGIDILVTTLGADTQACEPHPRLSPVD